MKRLLASAILTVSLALSFGGIATAASNSPLSAAYKAVYCYPTGTYWASQIASFPGYYASHNATFQAKYGATTRYCN